MEERERALAVRELEAGRRERHADERERRERQRENQWRWAEGGRRDELATDLARREAILAEREAWLEALADKVREGQGALAEAEERAARMRACAEREMEELEEWKADVEIREEALRMAEEAWASSAGPNMRHDPLV